MGTGVRRTGQVGSWNMTAPWPYPGTVGHRADLPVGNTGHKAKVTVVFHKYCLRSSNARGGESSWRASVKERCPKAAASGSQRLSESGVSEPHARAHLKCKRRPEIGRAATLGGQPETKRNQSKISDTSRPGTGSRNGSRKSGTGSMKSGTGSRKSGIGSRKSGTGSRKSGTGAGSQERGAGNQE